jgi:dihydrofolate reductase
VDVHHPRAVGLERREPVDRAGRRDDHVACGWRCSAGPRPGGASTKITETSEPWSAPSKSLLAMHVRPPRRAKLIGAAMSRLDCHKHPSGRNQSPMSSLMVDFIISLDGYGAAEGWPGLWGMEGPEYLAWVSEDGEGDHTTLMDATTYRLMSGFAAEIPDDPGLAALTAMPKVVFSSTLGVPLSWANTELIDRDAAEAVRVMKQRDSRPMRTLGSLTLCRSLLQARLVDRFRVVVFPVITGATGRDRIFDGYPDIALELVESRTFDGRLQLLEYVPTVLDGPPGVGD